MGIQVRGQKAYPNDPGDGLRIDASCQMVEIGMTFDGAERYVFHIHPDTLIEIAEEAKDWRPED